MRRRLVILLLVHVWLLPAAAHAAPKGQFNVTCRWVHTAFDDPIVLPGQPGLSHLHTFFGNPSINAHSTNESLLKTFPSTCSKLGDRSAYWVPSAYAEPSALPPGFPLNASGVAPVPPLGRAVMYYRVADREPSSIKPFPPGLRMVSGDGGRRSMEMVSWRCVSGAIEYADAELIARLERRLRAQRRTARQYGRAAWRYPAERRYYRRMRAEERRKIRETKALLARALGGHRDKPSCGDEGLLSLSVRFPDCWDGKQVDSADHMSHMTNASRPSRYALRECPDSHPVPVPRLTVNVFYGNVPASDVKLSSGPSNTAHADFMNAWDQDELERLVRGCLNADLFCQH